MPFTIVSHPLIAHKMTMMRDKETRMKEFRELVSEITLLLSYEATRELQTRRCKVTTPLCETEGDTLEHQDLVIAPILRAGLGMMTGMLDLLPKARVAHIGLRRNEETKVPETYYTNVPEDLSNSTVILVDPMLATAGSLCAAIEYVKRSNPAMIIALCLIGCPEGKKIVESKHPDVHVYLAAMDEKLNENAYILPGLGDAGDRMFGSA